MPIVEAFGNRNLQEVHWNEIKALLKIEDFPLEERQFQLKQLIEFNVASKQEEIVHISVTATQEHNLRRQVDEIEHALKTTEFEVIRHKDKDAHKLASIDVTQATIDELLNNISDISGSRYVKRLAHEVSVLQMKLITISECLEQWKMCQRNWLYLENIFSSKDICDARKKDSNDFDAVNRAWGKLMKKVNSRRNVRQNCNDYWLQEFTRMNIDMDRITKNLETYLEVKRSEFPRFYFISNDELLQLLAT